MVCLVLEPGVAGWKTQTNPLSNGGTQKGLPILKTTKSPNLLSLNQSQR